MNKVILIGNLTRDPELTETSSGVSICRFAIAVNRNYRDNEGNYITDFFNCISWRNLGETIAKYAKKGNKIMVVGSIEQRNYEDNNGNKRLAVDINVTECEFLTPKAREDENDFPAKPTTKKKPILTPIDDDDDIPF